MKKKMSVVYLVLATVTIIAFQNCGKAVNFSSTNDVSGTGGNDSTGTVSTDPVSDDSSAVDTDVPTPEVVDGGEVTEDNEADVIPSCGTSKLSEQIIDVSFNSSESTCQWNADGNLGKRNKYIQARREEVQNLDLPSGATICDMEFEFVEQTFHYDDHVIMTFNDRILLNTGSDMHKYLNSDGSGYIYDWSKLVGQTHDVGGTNLYCNGGSTCQIPDTDKTGKILVDIPKSKIQQIMTMAPQSTHQIKMITTGDDDSNDCRHTPVSFKVKVKYY